MSNNLSAEYYQDNKEKLQKKVCERYQSFSKKDKKKKIKNMVMNDTKIKQKIKSRSWLTIRKSVIM